MSIPRYTLFLFTEAHSPRELAHKVLGETAVDKRRVSFPSSLRAVDHTVVVPVVVEWTMGFPLRVEELARRRCWLELTLPLVTLPCRRTRPRSPLCASPPPRTERTPERFPSSSNGNNDCRNVSVAIRRSEGRGEGTRTLLAKWK